jgi:hypothetical protein
MYMDDLENCDKKGLARVSSLQVRNARDPYQNGEEVTKVKKDTALNWLRSNDTREEREENTA